MSCKRLVIAAWIAALGAALPTPRAWSADAPPPLESLQTLRIDGDVSVDADGVPIDYRPATALTDAQRAVLDRLVRSWRFQPGAGGEPATARLRITLAARSRGQGYDVVVDGVSVLRTAAGPPRSVDTPAGRISIHGRPSPPVYPTVYAADGVSAEVHLLLRIGSDGLVRDVAADRAQLLNVYGPDDKLRRALESFEAAAMRAARSWRFDVRLRPGQPGDADFVVGIPVTFLRFGGDSDDAAGQWRSEIRVHSDPPAWAQGKAGDTRPVDDDAFGLGNEEYDRFQLRSSVIGTPVI